MEEINGERVDMLEWNDDAIKLISTALQPAAISAVIIVNDDEHFDAEGRRIKKRAAVFVEEAQRPMAIGKKGQNIRLATDLTGFELDMYNYEELPAFKAKLAQLRGEEVIVHENIEVGEDSEEATEAVAERSEQEKQELVMETDPAPASEEGEGSVTPDEGQPLAGEGAVAA
jgi:N utilization substance protein A